MKKAVLTVLLVIASIGGSLAAEIAAPETTGTDPSLAKIAPVQSQSAAGRLPGLEAQWPTSPQHASSCAGRPERTIFSYWGFQHSTLGDSCPVVCGPCETEFMTNKLVGQVIYECDGSITQWGLICERSERVSYDSCPFCAEEY
jgi:hypothetical protein